MRIVLLGATGLVGNHLLTELMSDRNQHQVLILGRSEPKLFSKDKKVSANTIASDEQVTFISTDLADEVKVSQAITHFKGDFDIDILICCLGTTIKEAGSRQAFYHVDHDLVLNSANVAKQSGIRRMMLISAINSNPRSGVFYSKVKGQIEHSLKALNFDQLIIIKPSLLMGKRKTFRFAESLSAPIVKLVNPLMQGALKKYRGIEGEAVAECMVKQLNNPKQGVLEVYPADYL